MISYSIKQLENLSGIKAHTIRTWEKRYNFLVPERSDSNIRHYSSDQLIKILNACVLLKKGYKISYLSQLNEKEIAFLVKKELDSDGGTESLYINKFIAYTLQYDEHGFEILFEKLVTKYGLEKTILTVVYPFLIKMGVMWQTHELSPAQEHFASHIISKKIYVAIDKLPRPMGSTSFILFLLPGELHELGLLLSNYLLKKNGVKVLYLGANLSISNIQDAVRQVNAKNLFTILHLNNNLEKNFLFLQELSLSTNTQKLFFSAPKSVIQSYEYIPKAKPIDGIDAFYNMINSLNQT